MTNSLDIDHIFENKNQKCPNHQTGDLLQEEPETEHIMRLQITWIPSSVQDLPLTERNVMQGLVVTGLVGLLGVVATLTAALGQK